MTGGQAHRIAAFKQHRRGGDARAAIAAIAAEAADLAAQAADGVALVPDIGFAEIAAAQVPAASADRVRRHGCVVVRGVFPAAQASEWNAQLADYLARNDADGKLRQRYPARWQGSAPQMYSLYWSRPQVLARQAEALAAVRRWLNRLWRWEGHFDPDAECSYADRIRRRTPGDTTLSLRPHIDGGTAGRWLDAAASLPYRAALAGDLDAFDPFDATGRTAPADATDANGCAVFRTWQGWTALTAQGPGDGTLQVVPLARAIAAVLLRPFLADVSEASLCGAEASPALWITPQWHADLLRALVPIPLVQPGDTVWWHPDLIHAVEPAHGGRAESNVMYIPAAPDCPRNRAFLARQWPAFEAGRSPPDFPADDLEVEFAGRAGAEVLTALGRRQMGMA
jgi:Protein of unknown function (DUF1479)